GRLRCLSRSLPAPAGRRKRGCNGPSAHYTSEASLGPKSMELRLASILSNCPPSGRASGPTVSLPLVTLDEIRAAAERIRPAVAQTPLLRVGDGRTPRPFNLKCEHFHPMGAFKLRGAYNVLSQLGPEARAAGVITYSSGNHG